MSQPTIADAEFKWAYSNLSPWLLLSLCLLAAVVYPAFTHEYLFHDDWIHYSNKAASCSNSRSHTWFGTLGRPLGHEILCRQFKITGGISYAYIARGITFLGLAGLLVVTYTFLRREHLPDNLSSFLALGIAVLPGFTISVSWLGAGFIVFALLFSASSVLLCQHALMQKNTKRKFYGLLLTAVALEIASDLTYQTGAMFSLVLIAILYAIRLNNREQSILRDLLVLIGVFFVANLVYFIGFKIISGADLARVNPERGVLFHDLIGSFNWFIQYPLPRALHLWFVQPSNSWTALPIVTLIAYVASLAIFTYSLFFRKNNPPFSLPVLIYIPVTLLLGLACFFPMLVSSFRLEVFRSLTPLSSFIFSIIVIQFWLSFSNKEVHSKNINYSIAMAMFVVTLISQNAMLSKIIMPKYVEVQYIKNTMKSAKEAGFSHVPVHIIVPKLIEPWNTDEVGYLTSSFSQDVYPMIKTIRDELMLLRVTISHSELGEDFDPGGKIVIDLSVIPNAGISKALEKSFKFHISN